jgi:hypothetical protein
MPALAYSSELVDLARTASLAVLQRASDAEPLFRAYIAALRAESEPYPKAILPAYFVTGVDPRAEDGYIAAAIAHAAFILELALPTDVIDTFTIAARHERRCSAKELAVIIATGSAHVVWSLNGVGASDPVYTVTTFPAAFPANAIEVWWPLIRPCEAPVLRLLPDGSWQELNADCYVRASALGRAPTDSALPSHTHRLAKSA